jgi:hypothetical protein
MFFLPLNVCLLAVHIHNLYYAAPLIVVVSLVYSATRHEYMQAIINGAIRVAIWITGFMGIIFLILWGVGRLV